MKEVCTSSLLLLFVDILTLVQSVFPDNNYCSHNPVTGFKGNAVHACKDSTASGGVVAMDISHFDGSDCFCHLRHTGEIDNHTIVEVNYRTQNRNLLHRIEIFAVNQNNDTEGISEKTRILQVSSGGPTNITVRSKSSGNLRKGNLCVSFKLENDSYDLNLTCFNAAYSEQDLGINTENPTVVKLQSTQIATTPLQTTHRRTSTTTAIPTTHTTTTTVQRTPRPTSTITARQKIKKKTSLGATTTVISSSKTVSTQRVKQTSDVTVKNSATIEYEVNSEENDKSTAAIQAGTVKIIIIVSVSAVVCIVAVVLVVCCLKRRRRQVSRATVSQQSTHQNDEDYEITENAMYIPYIPTNNRNADCDNIYEEAEIDTNQSGKEAASLLQVHEVSRKDVDPLDDTLK